MLLAKSSDGSNVLLIACLNGSKLIEFIIQQAIRLGIKDMLLNQTDEQGRSPLYRLCQRGYNRRRK